MRVVHVVEAWGGGVQNVVGTYIKLTGEHDHQIIARPRDEETHAPLDAPCELHRTSVADFLTVAARRLRALEPDVVHLHSSWAGLLRSVPLRLPTVYTPHAFAFLRSNVTPVQRSAYHAVERLLARRGVVAACSPYELELAQRMGATAFYLPPAHESDLPPTQPVSGAPMVVTIGRVSPQKDPAFFAACAEHARALGRTDISWLWVGGGQADLEERLRKADVTVTGWLPGDQVTPYLDHADAYLHVARWEGTPLAFLEASARDLPVVARTQAYLAGLPVTQAGDSVAEVVATLLRMIDDPRAREEAVERSRTLVGDHSPGATRAGLVAAYASATGQEVPTVRRTPAAPSRDATGPSLPGRRARARAPRGPRRPR